MSQSLVTDIKSQLVAQGVDLSGPCGAFQIVKRVAWALRGTGAGLLHKRPEQNGCSVGNERYAVDIIMYPDGRAIDCLSDAGGANGPLWNAIEPIDSTLYRTAIDPGDAPIPPDPLPPTNDLALVLKAMQAHHEEMTHALHQLDGKIALASQLLSDQIVEVKIRQDRSLTGHTKAFGGSLELRPKE